MRYLGLGLFLLLGVTAFADDEIKLKNGDRLSGKITDLSGGKLTIETAETGTIKVDWAKIVSIKTDAPVKLKLSTKELLEGKVSPGAEGKLKIESAGAGAPVEVEMAKVSAINETPVAWHGKVTAAGRATDGNTHNSSFLVTAEAT